MIDVDAIYHWLVEGAPGADGPATVVGRMNEALVAAGIPIELGGTHSHAGYVGYPREKVLSRETTSAAVISLAPPEQKNWTDFVGSFHTSDGKLHLFPLAGDVQDYLFAGPSLENQVQSSNEAECVPLDEWLENSFPKGGFHIDATTKQVDYWTATDVAGVPRRISEVWHGWSVIWHRASEGTLVQNRALSGGERGNEDIRRCDAGSTVSSPARHR
ncbi:MAG: hypothetical protein IPM54_40135 [Polyangiaceae bacterium]|nr:hypothetical protein [Polyangiaceae bacterium]